MKISDYPILQFKLSNENPFEVLLHEYDQKEDSFDMHYELEMGIVLEGKIIRDFSESSLKYLPGDVWLHGSWEPHRNTIEDWPCKVIVLVINPVFLASSDLQFVNWMSAFSLPPHERKNANNEQTRIEIERISKSIIKIWKSESPLKQIQIKTLVNEILLLLMDGAQITVKKTTDRHQVTDKLQEAINLIFNSRNKRISIDEAAKACAMSKSSFSSLFNQYMGISFHKFALRYRLNRAAIALQKSDLPIATIAEEWGFTDISHFSHTFMEHYQVTPNSYRKRYH